MKSEKRRRFPAAFKLEVVDRVRTSGPKIVQVADEFGLHETVLRRWIRRFDPPEMRPARSAGQPSTGRLPSPPHPITQAQAPSPADLAAENDEPCRAIGFSDNGEC